MERGTPGPELMPPGPVKSRAYGYWKQGPEQRRGRRGRGTLEWFLGCPPCWLERSNLRLLRAKPMGVPTEPRRLIKEYQTMALNRAKILSIISPVVTVNDKCRVTFFENASKQKLEELVAEGSITDRTAKQVLRKWQTTFNAKRVAA